MTAAAPDRAVRLRLTVPGVERGAWLCCRAALRL